MQKNMREWVDSLRERYPIGSKIRLNSMDDPYHPVPPGTVGELVAIDDVGTLHVKWQNGSSLGLIVGEDSFTVLKQEENLHEMKME